MSVPFTISPAQERELLAAARTGDELAYRGLVEPHQSALHAHCYRMLGSAHDAEDAVQETLLRAWRGLPRFEGRSTLRAWLYTIATNTCLNALARRPKRVLPLDNGPAARLGEEPGRPLVESVWLEPYADEQHAVEDGYAAPEARYEQRESLELAFVAALQHLPARQRAVLILREVLGFSARETAGSLETTVASVNSALQRARKVVDELVPEQSQQVTLRALGDDAVRTLAERYADAIEQADTATLLAMLTDDASWSMPPLATWYHGLEAIEAFLEGYPLRQRWRHLPTRANGQLAVGCYMWDEERGCYAGAVIDVLTLRADLIAEVTAFIFPELFERFGLPSELPPR